MRSFRLLGTVSSDSIRCTNFINSNESDLRISSVDNTCTDSLVTALDDEALLICDATNEMARTKVNQSIKSNSFHCSSTHIYTKKNTFTANTHTKKNNTENKNHKLIENIK